MNLMRTLSLFKSIACVAMLSGLFLCSDVSAFGVNWLFFHHIPLPGTPVHEAITRAALLGFPPFRLSSGQVIEFSFPAITQIADENAATDSKATGNPERHFDAESFDDGQSFLIKARKAIISDLKTAVDNGDNARRLLGGSLHTLQDFYAHSTWVENGNHGTAPLGQDGATLSHAAFGADVCDRFGVLVGQPLTSSYWDNVNIVYGSTDYQFIVGYSIHKCGHGKPNTCNDPGLCPSDFLSMLPPILKTDAGGIHKDTNVRQHFHEAATLAEQSTREYIQHIFSDLGSEDLSACKLMGVDCYLLFLKKDGSGSGVIKVSDPPAYDMLKSCAPDCTLTIKGGSVVKLEAKADPGFEFIGWGQDCSAHGTTNPIDVTLSKDTWCSASFGVLPAVRLNPYGSKNLSDGPFYLELVDATFSPTTTTEDVTVTLLRQVFSNCRGLLFSSNRVVGVSKSQSYSSDLSGYVAGRDPFCTALPIRTELTITSAILGSSKALNLTTIPAAQRKVAITR